MTRLDLVNLVKERLGLSQAESLRVTEEVFSAISSILKEEGRLELRGFGTFLKKVRKARIGRIISLNKPIKVPGYKTVVFVPGKDLKRITLQPLK
ncbi:MAG: HU family DNA-binding protein [bacterium]